ncbi:oxysterol-binding protein-related protein 9-like, partial [Tropilaelaps mercedesae]
MMERVRPAGFDSKFKELDQKLQQRTESLDEKERVQLEGVCAKANKFLETVKHSIVSLQIAKNTTDVSSSRGEQLAANGGSLQSLRSPTESLQISAFNSSGKLGIETPSEPHHQHLTAAGGNLGQSEMFRRSKKEQKEAHVNNSHVPSGKNHHMVNSPSE